MKNKYLKVEHFTYTRGLDIMADMSENKIKVLGN